MIDTIRKKLNPDRFPNMSGMMAAIVGYFLDESYTEPEIVDLCVTIDNCVLARVAGDCGCNQFIGAYTDLERNWRNLLSVGGLTPEEMVHCIDLLQTKMQRV